MPFAPVALFTYKRLEHTQKTVSSLQMNPLADQTELIFFSDGPRSDADKDKVLAVRSYLRTVDGFKKVTIIEQDRNYGLVDSILYGVTRVLNEHGSIIVLEDDMCTSPHFLRYMNDGLAQYAMDKRVGTIQAHSPFLRDLPDFFFLLGADCWGWATWQDRWALLQTDAVLLLQRLHQKKALRHYDTNGADGQLDILLSQLQGWGDSWHALWCATTFLHGLLALHPGKSFIKNIGLDGTGTHGGHTAGMPQGLADEYNPVPHLAVEENVEVANRFYELWRQGHTQGIKEKIRKWLIYSVLIPLLCLFPGLIRRLYPQRNFNPQNKSLFK